MGLAKEIISSFLPDGLVEHFSVTHLFQLGDISSIKFFFEIHLAQNNKLLDPVDASQYESKGFTEITLQDFPIRGKAVYLKIKRRRCRYKLRPNEIIRNDFS